MIEFNPDGSIKLPDAVQKSKERDVEWMQTQRCIKVLKQVKSYTAPKACVLRITLSRAFVDNMFVKNLYGYFRHKASTPTKFTKIDDRTFEVEIGSDFRRCSDCRALIGSFREFLDGNVIEDRGSCTYDF